MHLSKTRTRLLALWVLVAPLILLGCKNPSRMPDEATVSANLVQRVGHSVPTRASSAEIVLPPGASLADGLTEDEAVSIALWNNAAFQELLVDLGIARGDLIQAGLLPNPEFIYFFEVANKPFKYALELPIEAIWLRPIRIKGAANEADRTAQRLAQAGLDLMRDVRQAYADVVLARERVRVAKNGVDLRGQIAGFAEKRFKAGDASEQEAATGKIDAAQAEQDATRIEYDVPVLEERLRNLMGIGPIRGSLPLDPSPLPPLQTFDADQLTQNAIASRPDAIAAAEAVVAAEARLRFAKLGWFRVLGIGDASSGRATGHEFGPAVRLTVPIFNRNQGNIERAEAELEKAVRNQKTVAYQIILDVQRSYLQYRQACAELEVLKAKVRPEVEGAVRRAQAAYREGNVPIFIVLETTRQRLDTDLREAILQADVRRFWAELERSVGHRLLTPVAPLKGIPTPPQPEPEPKEIQQSKFAEER